MRLRHCFPVRAVYWAAILITLLWLFAGPCSAQSQVIQTTPTPAPQETKPVLPPRCVIVVVADRLAPSDLSAAPPQLQELLATASVGTMSSRAIHSGGDVAAYATIGAGSEVWAVGARLPTDMESFPRYFESFQRESERHFQSWPGYLGSDVQSWRSYTAVIGNADTDTRGNVAAAMIAADAYLGVSVNLEHAGELLDQQSWPYRRRSSPQVLAQTVLSVIAQHPHQEGLIVVETGDSSRVDSWVWLNNRDPSEAAAARSHWTPVILQQLTELLTPLVRAARENGYLLCFVSPTPPRQSDGSPMPSLTPAAIWGPGFSPGPLVSRTSPRPGLALLSDLTPTFLHYLSRAYSSTLQGHLLQESSEADRPSVWDFQDVRKVMKKASYDTSDFVFQRIAGMLVALVLGCALLWPAVSRGEPLVGIRARVMQFMLLASCAGPAALIIPLCLPGGLLWLQYLLFLALWLLIPLLIFRLRKDLWRMGAACALPALLIAVDTVTGGRLFRDVLLSRTPIEGSPLFGLGSLGCGVLTGAGLLALGVWVDSAPQKKHVRKWTVVMATVIGLIVGLPSMGANFVGWLAAVTGAGLFGLLVFLNEKGWRRVLYPLLGMVLPILAFLALFPLAASGHLERPPVWDLFEADRWKFLAPVLGFMLILSLLFVFTLRLLMDDGMGLRKRLAALPGLRAALWSLLPIFLCSALLEEDGMTAAAILTAYAAFPLVYLHLARRALVGESETRYNNEQTTPMKEAKH